MAVALNTKQEDTVIDTLLGGPPVPVGGRVTDGADKLVKVSEIAKAVVGKMKVGGFSFGEILSVLVALGTFIAEHGDDIEAVWQKVLDLFPNKKLSA